MTNHVLSGLSPLRCHLLCGRHQNFRFLIQLLFPPSLNVSLLFSLFPLLPNPTPTHMLTPAHQNFHFLDSVTFTPPLGLHVGVSDRRPAILIMGLGAFPHTRTMKKKNLGYSLHCSSHLFSGTKTAQRKTKAYTIGVLCRPSLAVHVAHVNMGWNPSFPSEF